MKVSYDAQIFHEQAYGGVSRYVCELAARISRLDAMEVSITAPMHINAYLESLPAGLVSGFRLPGAARLPLSVRAAGMLMGDVMLRGINPDLIHETYYFPYRTGPRRARRVVTIHDMIHEKLPSFFAATDRTPKFKRMAAERADHIICVSEQTRRDLMELRGIEPGKISVVHHGFGLMAKGEATAGSASTPKLPFLLYVGPRGGYKNFSGLLSAYAASKRLRRECHLVCFGGGKFTPAERDAMARLELDPGTVFQVAGDDDVLASLYRSAIALVYPSLYEGFGIPPLEAMCFGCPVICSSAGSIPEIVGDAGKYFNPLNMEEMSDIIESTVHTSALLEALAERGRQRLKQFSWDRCALETAAIYRRLA
ncbi:glycosyltransferase family 4 protein [Citrifermentans bremense]|uniref:glycosyltransferase family 4 protein n=1 Tax=Citrifermentans bremense TaxID=60035 RepID=UPI00042041D0|nr:glycosyltransferase family 1 protein [Citrifermentans bremense]